MVVIKGPNILATRQEERRGDSSSNKEEKPILDTTPEGLQEQPDLAKEQGPTPEEVKRAEEVLKKAEALRRSAEGGLVEPSQAKTPQAPAEIEPVKPQGVEQEPVEEAPKNAGDPKKIVKSLLDTTNWSDANEAIGEEIDEQDPLNLAKNEKKRFEKV